MPIDDCSEELVDLAGYKELVVDESRKYIWNQKEPFSLARKGVAEKLLSAQKQLPEAVRLMVVEGYRSQNIQQEIFQWQRQEFKKQHPDWNEKRLMAEVLKFVASPETNMPHSTGGAIDIMLVNESGDELDMGTGINEGYDGQCLMNADNISDIAKKNRRILIEALEKTGFVNYPAEWWHWSYGDRYWAAVTNSNFAIYGCVKI